MARICVVFSLICFYFVESSDGCNSDDTFTVVGYAVCLKWKIEGTFSNKSHATVNHSTSQIALVIDGGCETQDPVSMNCTISNNGHEWLLSLIIVNVTETNSGNYSLLHHDSNQTNKENNCITLEVIAKPSVREIKKPVLYHAFELSCDIPFRMQCVTYIWKINGSEIIPIAAAFYVSSINMTYSFSQVTCQVCLNKTISDDSTVIPKRPVCSEDSDPYDIKVIYGPNNVSLSVSEKELYIRQYEKVLIHCFADCSPNCICSWTFNMNMEGEIDCIDGDKLIINSFDLRMTGLYTCHVKNMETNITSNSSLFLLLEEKDIYLAMTGSVLIAFAVLLAVIGALLITHWRRNAANKTDSHLPPEPVTNRQISTNGGESQDISRIPNRPLPLPNIHETTNRRPCQQMDQLQNRNSQSLHNLLDSAHNGFHPLRRGVSLQSFQSHLNRISTIQMNITEVTQFRHISISEENNMDYASGPTNGNNLEEMYAKVQTKKKINKYGHNADALENRSSQSEPESFKESPMEDVYYTIDDVTL